MKTLTWHTKLAVGIAGLSAGTILAMALGVMAEDTELDSDPRVFPYRGVLELDGESFTGLADFRFTVTDEGECDFVEEHGDVDVFAGAFAVNIGANTNGGVDDCVFDAQRIFLHIAVRDAQDEGDFTALSGRQRITPVPFAYWAAEGSDLRIDGNVNATGDANFGGALNAGGDLTINGTGAVIGSDGRPPSGQARLILGRNPTSDNIIDDYNDFQLVLHRNNTPESTYGLGIQTSRLFANTNGSFGFQVEGIDEFTLSARTATFNTELRFSGTLADTDSDVVVDDGFVVEERTRLRGNLENDRGDVNVNDNLTVTGDLTVTGSITNLRYEQFNYEVRGALNTSIDLDPDHSACFIGRLDRDGMNADVRPDGDDWSVTANNGTNIRADDLRVGCLVW